MTYLGELRVNWRYLAAASAGLASGVTLNLYIANTFAPHLLKEFGWSKSQFALIGQSIIFATIALPIVGRLTDIIGVRRIITIGIASMPLIFIAYSRMDGNFLYFFLINVVQVSIGATTSSLVYSRLIAENFSIARGLAFSIAACAAPATGAVISRFLSGFIEAHGWRSGYLLVAAGTAAGGVLAVLLLPRRPSSDVVKADTPPVSRTSRDYPEILRNPAFQRIAVGMLLCNLTVIVQSSQLKLILLDRSMAAETATWMISLYAAGIVIGRLSCGVALDRFPTPIVSALCLGFPSIGLFILASGLQDTLFLAAAVMVVGLSLGAELDVLAYLVMRYFKVEVYSTVFGIIQPVISLSAALGSVLLSATLKISGGFSVFLYLAAVMTLVGSVFFLMLRGCVPVSRHPRQYESVGIGNAEEFIR